jgi:hypothetical protein
MVRHLAFFRSFKLATVNAEKLRQQKRGLMHDLLTGRVRVKVDA